MSQQELTCPRCRQVNLRSSGSGLERVLTNPKYPDLCTLCRTDLKSGKRAAVDIPAAWIMWFGMYMIYAVALIGLCSFPFWFFALLTYQVEQILLPVTAATSLGLGLGLWIAEKKRRRGELLYKSKRHW